MTRATTFAFFLLCTSIAAPCLAQAPAAPAPASVRVIYLAPGPTPGSWVEVAGPPSTLRAAPPPAPTRLGLPRTPVGFDLSVGETMLGGGQGNGNTDVEDVVDSWGHDAGGWVSTITGAVHVHPDGSLGGFALGLQFGAALGHAAHLQVEGRAGYDFAIRTSAWSTVVFAPYAAFGDVTSTGSAALRSYFVVEAGFDLRAYFGDVFYVCSRVAGGYAFDGDAGHFSQGRVTGGIGISL